MKPSKVRIWSLVLVPALITLLVTGVRLFGELQGWNSQAFGRDAGSPGSLVGIVWLVPIFGMWFGYKLRQDAPGVKPGRASVIYVVAAAAFALSLYLLIKVFGLVEFPSEEKPGPFRGLPYLFGGMAIGSVIALVAWPRLTLTLMVYGILARLPVVLVTYFDVYRDWDTHYGALPPGAVTAGVDDTFLGLISAQVTFWPFLFTPVVGGIFGCIGASLARKRKG